MYNSHLDSNLLQIKQLELFLNVLTFPTLPWEFRAEVNGMCVRLHACTHTCGGRGDFLVV